MSCFIAVMTVAERSGVRPGVSAGAVQGIRLPSAQQGGGVQCKPTFWH